MSAEGKKRRLWPVLTPLALMAVGISLIWPAGRHQWELSLFRQSTNYTALYFNKAWDLPASAVKDKPLAISFSVSNHEGRLVRYHYVITQSADGRVQTLRESTKFVGIGATWNVSTIIRPSCVSSPCRVEISLPGHPETVDFLVSLKASRAGRA